MNYIEVNTPCGAVRGISREEYDEFRGIRYAFSERFDYPVQVKKWDGVYDATNFGDCACQHRAFDDDAKVNAFYHNEFRKGLEFTYSEDCLFLNIYKPKNAEKCPVILYIHGGSFTGGSANEGQISGARYAKNGVITVAINYRLGAFGFCSHPDLEKDGVCGNFGLFDQACAIQWVYDNIEAFGGDKEKITLMGQSAGAMSVDIHLSNPLVRDKISGAIMISGVGLQRLALKPKTPKKTRKFWDKIIHEVGAKDINELRIIDKEKLYRAWDKVCKENKLAILYQMPVYDGVIIKKGNFDMKSVADVPTIISVTATDMMPPILNALIKKWSKYSEKNFRSPCFVYHFDRLLPGDDKGAWHSCDLLYAFSTLDFNWRPFTDHDRDISRKLSQCICAFAKNGDPKCDAVPEWKSGIKEPMRFV